MIVNNIEFDHADIYSDIDAILWQFHQLLRTVPGNGLIVANGKDANIERLLQRGVWTPLATFSASDRAARWFGAYDSIGAQSSFSVFEQGAARGRGRWSLLGQHNLENALAAIAAAGHVGVAPRRRARRRSREFKGVKRRLELRGTFGGITLYEDFAHHPTAIATTLAGLQEPGTASSGSSPSWSRARTRCAWACIATRCTARSREPIACSCSGAADLGWDPAAALAPLGATAWSWTPTCRGCSQRLLDELTRR